MAPQTDPQEEPVTLTVSITVDSMPMAQVADYVALVRAVAKEAQGARVRASFGDTPDRSQALRLVGR